MIIVIINKQNIDMYQNVHDDSIRIWSISIAILVRAEARIALHPLHASSFSRATKLAGWKPVAPPSEADGDCGTTDGDCGTCPSPTALGSMVRLDF